MSVEGNGSALKITRIDVNLSGAQVLKQVSGETRGGEILAILGPSGCGKTTLLNAIAGRQSVESGEITFNGEIFTKQHRRRLGLVLQHDIFFSKLTLWETLYFAAMIRMPETVSESDKLLRLDEVIDKMGLRSSLDTLFGDKFTKGLSGGEKKRANIACELLADPDILLLDEPTTGLDSSTAYILMKQLKTYTANSNKIVISTIHQPSSQIYQMFDGVLLLANGKAIYSGPGHDQPLLELKKAGLVCDPLYNPADFLVDVLKSDQDALDKIKEGNPSSCSGQTISKASVTRNSASEMIVNPKFGNTRLWSNSHDATRTPSVYLIGMRTDNVASGSISLPSGQNVLNQQHETKVHPGSWSTSFCFQFRMNLHRCLKQERRKLSSPVPFVLPCAFTLTLCLTFFQLPDTPSNFRDKMGLITAFCVTWFSRFQVDALRSVQAEWDVVSKERAARWYRVSTYLLAKSVSYLPVMGSVATASFTAIYWVSGVGDVKQFFATLPLFWLNILFGQSTGTLFGIGINDSLKAQIAGRDFLIASLLLGGLFSQSLPWWFAWTSYLSGISYMMKACVIILSSNMDNIPCEYVNKDVFSQCLSNTTSVVTAEEFLHTFTITLPLYAYVTVQVALIIIVCILGYVALRMKRSVPLQ